MSIHPFYIEGLTLALGATLLLAEGFLGTGRRTWIAIAGIVGLAGVLALTFFIDTSAPTRFVSYDPSALFFKRFLLESTIIVLVLAIEFTPFVRRYLHAGHENAGLGEFFAIPIVTCAGLMWLASATDFVMMFAALELVTISFYILVAYLRGNLGSLEAGVKYLILGALSTGFIVYGIVWLFGVTGETSFAGIAAALPIKEPGNEVALLFAFGLLLAGLGFKIAAVPFQLWVPDVYQGAPTPVTGFLSVASKAAGFAVLMRVIEVLMHAPSLGGKIIPILAIITGATLIYGNLSAMPQVNFKRLLAYSSVGHAGYLLLGVVTVTATPTAGPAVAFYLAAYMAMTFAAFLVLIIVTNATGSDNINDFAGLGQRAPFLAGTLLVAMLSLAGIPFTVGFIGKALIFMEALKAGHYVLVGIGVLAVASGFYYYLKVVRVMYWADVEPTAPAHIKASPLALITLALLTIGILAMGVYPAPLMKWCGFAAEAAHTALTAR